MAYVYRHIRLDKNEPFYIGIGTDLKYKRAFDKTIRNRFWKFIVSKTDYIVEILIDDEPLDFVLKKEVEFIKLYGRSNINTGSLCNLTDGGEGAVGCVLSDETKAKISIRLKGRKISNETKKKLSIANLGKKRTAAQIKDMSDRAKNRVYSLERNKKISETLKYKYAIGERVSTLKDIPIEKRHVNKGGYKHTQATKDEMSKNKMGNKGRLGLPHTEETKRKIGLANTKK